MQIRHRHKPIRHGKNTIIYLVIYFLKNIFDFTYDTDWILLIWQNTERKLKTIEII